MTLLGDCKITGFFVLQAISLFPSKGRTKNTVSLIQSRSVEFILILEENENRNVNPQFVSISD